MGLQFNLVTIVVGLAVGYALYKVVDNKEKSQKSNFSSACGCGK